MNLTREDCRTIAHELHVLILALKSSAENFDNAHSMTRYRTLEPLLNELGEDGLRLYDAVLAGRISCCCIGSDCNCLTWREAEYPLEYVIEADIGPAPSEWSCELQITEKCGERAGLFILDDGERRLACVNCQRLDERYVIEGRIEWTTVCDECGEDIGTRNANKHDARWTVRALMEHGAAPSSTHRFRPRPRVTVEATGEVAPQPRREGGVR